MVLCRDTFPAPSFLQKSLWNVCANLLPHNTNNWTGIVVAQCHTIQLSKLTPTTRSVVSLREEHGVGAVLDMTG